MNEVYYQYIIIGQSRSWFFERKFEVLHRFDFVEKEDYHTCLRTRIVVKQFFVEVN